MRKFAILPALAFLLFSTSAYALALYSNPMDSQADINTFDVHGDSLTATLDTTTATSNTMRLYQTDTHGAGDYMRLIQTGLNGTVYVTVCVYAPGWTATQQGGLNDGGIAFIYGSSVAETYITDSSATGFYFKQVPVTIAAGDSLEIRLHGPAGVSYWDNLTISDDLISSNCPSVSPPTPTPIPTATVTPGGPTPTITPTPTSGPTPTPGGIDSTFAVTVSIPGPLPLDPIDETIDLAPFWNVAYISHAISIIQTFFYLENIPEFFKIFLLSMGMVIGLRLIFAIIGARQTAARGKDGV